MQNFDEFDLRVGTIVDVSMNKRARKPAYSITIDFGEKVGVKKTSSPIIDTYSSEALMGMQVIAVINLGTLYIGDVKSEVKLLGIETDKGAILITSDKPVENGGRIY